MTEISETTSSLPVPHLKTFDPIVERADAARIDSELRTIEAVSSESVQHYLVLELPNGRQTRRVVVSERAIQDFLGTDFENYIVLGDYVAITHKISGRIEARLEGGGPYNRFPTERSLQQIPGVEIISTDDPELDQEALEEENATRNYPADKWRLVVKQDEISIEISPSSEEFDTLLRPGITIKLDGIIASTHDAALEALERYASAMLFDLDVVYGVSIQLSKQRRSNRRRRPTRPDHPPKFPRNQYAGQALELYHYGRAAASLPLLEYLAYYQSLEYFFPFFAREQTVNLVRSQILHPAFDASNDATLNRLINLAAPSARGGMAERDQLRATIRACMIEADVREFIESQPEYTDHFCSKKSGLKGVGVIQINSGQADLRDQIADRIYAIRCRIVHSKQDGGGTSEEVLLPSSAEANSLRADLEMLRLVAQRAIIARAARG